MEGVRGDVPVPSGALDGPRLRPTDQRNAPRRRLPVMAAPRVKPEDRLRAGIHDFPRLQPRKTRMTASAGMTGWG